METTVATAERLATEDEIRAAIEALTDDELMRLDKAARACIPGSDFQDADEVLNEAVKRAIDGCGKKTGRHWPIERVDFVAFLTMAMRGLASDSRDSELMAKTDHFDAANDDGSGSWTLDRLGHRTAGVEQRLIDAEDEAEEDTRVAKRQASARADADRIDKHFASDQEVAWLVMCLREEKAPSKARIAAGLTQTQYETIRKRMRRGLEKLFPGRSAR
ncbi:MAG TPA: hypothetical protein VF169_01575 [Albitalea sp.]|uniref:hypothetical protein n=1 Tax=Piscinibacter sp. TaxID=1903157 RepID=UPI002ED623FE